MSVQKRTVSLSADQAAFVDAKLATGDYTSVSEVVRAGLRALKERDQAVQQWLVNEVAPTYDAMKSNSEQALSVDSAFDDVRMHHMQRRNDKNSE